MKKTHAEDVIESYPITLKEFVNGLPKGNVESAKAFQKKMSGEAGSRSEKEWAELYAHFGNKPSGTAWAEWVKQLQKAEVISDGI